VAKLVVFRGDDVERELHIGSQTIRIGRDARNDVVLDDKAITRVHAEVTREGGTFYITDLNSRNGVWINKQRISGKTPLELGVPVTIGAYELTLEDDLGTSDLSAVMPVASHTVVSTAENPPERSSSSTTRGKAAVSSAKNSVAAAAVRKPAIFWPAIGVGTLVLCFVTYIAVRRFTARPAPQEVVATPPTTPIPVDSTPTPPPPTTPVTQDIVAGYIEAAQFAIEDKDFQAASDDIDAALELDPTNQDLLEKKKQIQDLAAAPPPVVKPRPITTPAVVEVAEVQGIARRPNESPDDYKARAGRIQVNMREGQRLLDAEDFSGAIQRFQNVERDQRSYLNVDALLADATGRQKKLVDTAINNGQENERAGNILNAVRWYDRAALLDPTSAAAKEKLANIADRRTKDGLAALTLGDVQRKRNDTAKALAAYQQAADLLPPGNEKKAEAQQWVEKLKQ
jgi:pSer/pThr/pTyr-binding forkhead associated (FHA) protein